MTTKELIEWLIANRNYCYNEECINSIPAIVETTAVPEDVIEEIIERLEEYDRLEKIRLS